MKNNKHLYQLLSLSVALSLVSCGNSLPKDSSTQHDTYETSSVSVTETTSVQSSAEAVSEVTGTSEQSSFVKREKAPYRVKIPSTREVLEIFDEDIVSYLDNLIENRLPQLEEVIVEDHSKIRNGDTYAIVHSDHYELGIRQFSDNYYNISLTDKTKDDGKLYLIPQEELDELMDIINSARPQ